MMNQPDAEHTETTWSQGGGGFSNAFFFFFSAAELPRGSREQLLEGAIFG